MNALTQPAARQIALPTAPSILRLGLVVLGRLGLALTLLVLALPVGLSLIGTGVPRILLAILALADAGFLLALFKFHRTLLTVEGFGGILLMTIAASQVYAATPPILDAQDQPIPGSIASLEKINLNGSEQWITIRGKNLNNPVLLHLGMGGPGGGGFATRGLFEPLEDRFTVVSWDEPGTGKSYNAVPMNALTRERFVEDAHALTQLLRTRFHQDKIYVYGVSWTSILGVWLVQQYPDLFYAYIGNGQMVNTTENDVMGYEFALKYLGERGDTARADALRRLGPPPYSGEGMVNKYVAVVDVLNEYMGTPPFSVVVPIVPLFAPEYGWVDKVNHTRGLYDSFAVVYPQLRDLDFIQQAPKLDVPVYIFAGKNDVNAMYTIVERYYSVLQAPHKELIWLEGGHGLDDSNLGQFTDVMVNTVLAQTQAVR